MKRILVVDDDRMLCRLTCDILSVEGYVAVPAFNGVEALEVFARSEFDAVVTDLRMPVMNGLELARRIHTEAPDMPVIMVTAYGPIQDEDITVCLAKEDLFPGVLDVICSCVTDAKNIVQSHRNSPTVPLSGTEQNPSRPESKVPH